MGKCPNHSEGNIFTDHESSYCYECRGVKLESKSQIRNRKIKN